jgi:hypothetical protein
MRKRQLLLLLEEVLVPVLAPVPDSAITSICLNSPCLLFLVLVKQETGRNGSLNLTPWSTRILI